VVVYGGGQFKKRSNLKQTTGQINSIDYIDRCVFNQWLASRNYWKETFQVELRDVKVRLTE